jgi:signal transduction histidine kinase
VRKTVCQPSDTQSHCARSSGPKRGTASRRWHVVAHVSRHAPTDCHNSDACDGRLPGAGGAPRVQQYLDEITGQATWISDMVHTMLHHAPTVEPEVVNVVDVTKRVVAVAAASGVTAVIELLAAPSVFAFVDRVLVGRAIANLVDNATRAAGPDGHVRLSVRSRGPAVVVIVEDDGPGFGEAPCGTGLGLSMTAFVASTCGGQLALKASELGGGKVTLTLPRTPPPPATTS